ncbi:hypothetical protein, partial [Plastoroseomonas hellenica]
MNELPGTPKPTAPSTTTKRRPRRRWMLWTLILVLLAGGGWYAWTRGWLPGSGTEQAAGARPAGFGPSGGP